jgi:cation diffusion facilitator CzcD-associated flavoprotein CzcO
VLYSFSFCPNPNWTTFYPEGAEIAKYFQDVCSTYGIIDKIQLNTDVKSCRWLASEKVWEITLQHLIVGTGDLSAYDRSQMINERGVHSVCISEEIIRAKVLVSGVGGLTQPNAWPASLPDRKQFHGDVFHSARWRHDVDLTNKNVIVVGTGSSAAQFVPQLTQKYRANTVTQVMRTPPWVVPRTEPPGGILLWERNSSFLMKYVPFFNRIFRAIVFWSAEHAWVSFTLFRQLLQISILSYLSSCAMDGYLPHYQGMFQATSAGARKRAAYEARMLTHMKSSVPPKYHQMLTPTYSVGCKRRIFDTTWFQSLDDPKIELTNLPITSLSANSITLGSSGSETDTSRHEVTLPADVIILANGYEATTWFSPLHLTGRDGLEIQEVWKERGGPQMYMGLALDSFPNYFCIFGPNTATGHSSVIVATENMVNLTLKLIKPLLQGDAEVVEVKKEAELKWTKKIQTQLQKTVWSMGGCMSWYRDKNGWNSTTYPYVSFFLFSGFISFAYINANAI